MRQRAVPSGPLLTDMWSSVMVGNHSGIGAKATNTEKVQLKGIVSLGELSFGEAPFTLDQTQLYCICCVTPLAPLTFQEVLGSIHLWASEPCRASISEQTDLMADSFPSTCSSGSLRQVLTIVFP